VRDAVGRPSQVVDDCGFLGSALFNEPVRHKMIAEAPDQTELPFMSLKYGQEGSAKHQVPDGKCVKVQCVHKSVSRIIQ
jgi:hypothetical protein